MNTPLTIQVMLVDDHNVVRSGLATEVLEEYRRRNEKVKLELVPVPATTFLDQVTVSDAEIAAQSEAHKADCQVPAPTLKRQADGLSDLWA